MTMLSEPNTDGHQEKKTPAIQLAAVSKGLFARCTHATKSVIAYGLNVLGYSILKTSSLRTLQERAGEFERTIPSRHDAPEPQANQGKNIEQERNIPSPHSVQEVKHPSVLFISIPKSGTVYTNRLLVQGLGFRDFPISLGYFPRDLVDHRRLRTFAEGGCIATEHLDPSAENLQILERLMKRWVVHLRDPRSVVLSWTHHIDRVAVKAPESLLNVCPVPSEDYLSASFQEKLWWNIHSFLPIAVDWIERWLRIIDGGRYEICLTTYDELVGNERLYIRRILDFFSIPQAAFSMPMVERSMDNAHFRIGRPDEWREAFSQEQLKLANKVIGIRLLERLRLRER
jgi:hypothetical protein